MDRVSGNVFASPSRVKVLGSSRQPGNEAMEVAYPDICFAVDESHAGFDSLVGALYRSGFPFVLIALKPSTIRTCWGASAVR